MNHRKVLEIPTKSLQKSFQGEQFAQTKKDMKPWDTVDMLISFYQVHHGVILRSFSTSTKLILLHTMMNPILSVVVVSLVSTHHYGISCIVSYVFRYICTSKVKRYVLCNRKNWRHFDIRYHYSNRQGSSSEKFPVSKFLHFSIFSRKIIFSLRTTILT